MKKKRITWLYTLIMGRFFYLVIGAEVTDSNLTFLLFLGYTCSAQEVFPVLCSRGATGVLRKAYAVLGIEL